MLMDDPGRCGAPEKVQILIDGVEDVLVMEIGGHGSLVEDPVRARRKDVQGFHILCKHELRTELSNDKGIGHDRPVIHQFFHSLLDDPLAQGQVVGEFLEIGRSKEEEVAYDDPVKRGFVLRSPLSFSPNVHLDPFVTPPHEGTLDEIRPLELPQHVLSFMEASGKFDELGVIIPGDCNRDLLQEILFLLCHGEAYRVERLEVPDILCQCPQFPILEHRFHHSLVHQLPAPFLEEFPFDIRILVDVPPPFHEKVQRLELSDHLHQILLPLHEGSLLFEILLDLGEPVFELLLRERGREHLPVQFPEECGPVLHEHDIGNAHEHDVVGQRGWDLVEILVHDPDPPPLHSLKHLPGIIDVHDVVQDLVVGLQEQGMVLHAVDGLQYADRAELLFPHGYLPAKVVLQDHEPPVRTVAEPLFEELGVANRVPEHVLELVGCHQLPGPLDRHPVREGEHEIVVREGNLHVGGELLRDLPRISTGEGIVHPAAEREVIDEVPSPPFVDESLHQELLFRWNVRDDGQLLRQVVHDGAGRTPVQEILLHEDVLDLPVVRSLREHRGNHTPELPYPQGKVVGAGKHLPRPGGDGGFPAVGILHHHPHPLGLDELVRLPAQEEDVPGIELLNEFLGEAPDMNTPLLEHHLERGFLGDGPEVHVVDHP